MRASSGAHIRLCWCSSLGQGVVHPSNQTRGLQATVRTQQSGSGTDPAGHMYLRVCRAHSVSILPSLAGSPSMWATNWPRPRSAAHFTAAIGSVVAIYVICSINGTFKANTSPCSRVLCPCPLIKSSIARDSSANQKIDIELTVCRRNPAAQRGSIWTHQQVRHNSLQAGVIIAEQRSIRKQAHGSRLQTIAASFDCGQDGKPCRVWRPLQRSAVEHAAEEAVQEEQWSQLQSVAHLEFLLFSAADQRAQQCCYEDHALASRRCN